MADSFTCLGAIGACAAVVVAILIYRRQIHAQMYLEYTKRCDAILQEFPPSVRLNLGVAVPGNVEPVVLLRYLNLCAEEFYMRKKKYLPQQVWEIWEGEIQRFLRSPLIREEWAALRKEYDSFPAFQQYVDTAQE